MASAQMQQFVDLMRAQREAAPKGDVPPEEARQGFEATLAILPAYEGAQFEPVDAGGVPAEWTHVDSVVEPSGTLLYFHGGGYMQGSVVTHRRLVAALAAAAGLRALSVDYRLAPENPFPAALDDARAAYQWLIGAGGEIPGRVVVAGDSAGGGLTAALLVALRDAGLPAPAGAYLMSPWTDLASTGESMTTRSSMEPMLDPTRTLATARMYRPEGDLDDPLVSPLYADPAGLGPLLIHVGDFEILLDDSTRLAERAASAGVDVELQVWPGAFHVFQMLFGLIPEADEAIAQAGAWMAKRVA